MPAAACKRKFESNAQLTILHITNQHLHPTCSRTQTYDIGTTLQQLMTILDLSQLTMTSTEVLTNITAVSFVQSDYGNALWHGEAMSRAPDNWHSTINIPYDYVAHPKAFKSMLERFKLICDGHLGNITTATYRIELEPGAKRPISFVPYRAGPKARNCGKYKIDNKLSMNVIERA